MIFSSVFFIFIFLPIVLLVYYIVPKKLKNTVILISSLIFYAWGEPVYLALMIFSIMYNYVAGIEISYRRDEGDEGRAKRVFWMAAAVNLLILGFFKYYGFLIDNLNHILPVDIPNRALALPVGISFYTFQTLSYVIDVYKGNVEVQKNLICFGTYISMFPQLIAGPIVRYADVQSQLTERKESLAKVGSGTAWFLRGLGKKVLLANNIGMAYDAIFFSPGIGSAVKYIGRMFGIGAAGLINPAAVYYLYNYILLFAVLILCSTPHIYRRFSVFMQQRTGRCRIAIAAYVVMFVLSVAYLVNATYNPFLYFRF